MTFDIADIAFVAFAMLVAGVLGGLLAGLLGVGGGIVIVPVLDVVLSVLGAHPETRLHVAVATSLATIIVTSISSARAHHAKGAVDTGLAKFWGAAIFAGAVAGTVLASRVDTAGLALVFGVVALLVALKMLFVSEDRSLTQRVPGGATGLVWPFGIGGLSSMMGIGGGTLSVPVLTLMNQPIHQAVGTAALFGLLISVPATAAYMWTGWNDARVLAGSVGYVNVIGFLVIAPVTAWMAPVGARLAHRLSRQQLSTAFGVFLLIVAVRMLYTATTA